MKIGNQEVREIQITDENNALIASITDENVILQGKVKITFVDSVYAGPEDSNSRCHTEGMSSMLRGCSKLVIETKEDVPQAIAMITDQKIDVAEDFQVRLTPD